MSSPSPQIREAKQAEAVGRRMIPLESVQAPPLVVLTGEEGRNPARVSALLDAGAVVVLATSPHAIRAWFPGAFHDARTPEDPRVLVRVSHLEIDLTEQRARWLDRRLDLSAHELRLLAALGGDGRVWTFEEIADRVWGSTHYGDRSVIHSAVKRLRKKLARAGVDVRIEAIRGVGLLLTSEMSSRKPSVDRGC
jgi:two-component system response regulator MtrA